MSRVNKQNPVDVLWERLAAAPSEDATARAVAAYEAATRTYGVPVLNGELRVVLPEKRVLGPDGPAGFEATLVALQYLLSAREEPLAGEWVDPRSLSYGDFFFRAPHELPTAKLEEAFGGSVDAFRSSAEALGGRALDMGDAAYELRVLPRVPIAAVLWRADDEFPARAQFLFDRTADRQLPLDALWVLCSILVKRLAPKRT
jgi:hypothetical protein